MSWKHLFEIYFRLLRRNNKLKINNFLTNIYVIIDISVFDNVKGLRFRGNMASRLILLTILWKILGTNSGSINSIFLKAILRSISGQFCCSLKSIRFCAWHYYKINRLWSQIISRSNVSSSSILPKVIIEVQSGNGVLNRLVRCVKCIYPIEYSIATLDRYYYLR